MRPTISALALVLFIGCQSGCQSLPRPEAGVRLATDRSSYAPGNDVLLRLTNGTDQAVGYNLCTAALEREADAGWLPAGEAEVCTMELRGLDPGASTTYTKHLPADLPEGRYRYVAGVEHHASGHSEQPATEPFPVGP